MKSTVNPYTTYPNGTGPSVYPQSVAPGYPTPYPGSEPPAYDKSEGMPYSPNPAGKYTLYS